MRGLPCTKRVGATVLFSKEIQKHLYKFARVGERYRLAGSITFQRWQKEGGERAECPRLSKERSEKYTTNIMRAVILCMAALAVLPLAGCTSKSVSTVKQTLSENKNFTIGEVLGNRTFCDKTKWSDSKSQAGDTIVEYSCSGAVGRDVTDNLVQGTRQNVEGKVKFMTDRFLNEERNAESSYKHAQSYQAEVDASANRLAQQIQDLNELKAEPVEGRTADEKLSIKSGIWQLERQVASGQANDSAVREGYAKQLAEATAHRQRVAALKEAYFADLQAAKAADFAVIDKLYPDSPKIEQKVFFVVDGDRSKVVRLEYYVDGKKVNAGPYSQLFMFRSELTTPKGPEPVADWKRWWSSMVARGFNSQVSEFEAHRCYGNRSCEDRHGADKPLAGS